VWCVGPGQRETVDQTVVQRAGVQVSAGRGGGRGGGKVGVSQRPRIAPPPARAAPAAPRQATRPAANAPRMISRLTALISFTSSRHCHSHSAAVHVTLQ